MKSHSSKAPRKSFDVTKMSGPDIAAEMARHMAEFKSGRPSDPVAGRKETTPSAPQSKQPANHPFLRASLAAEGSSSLAPFRSRDDGFETDARPPLGSEGGKGLAFLRRGLRHDHWPEITERRPVQYSRRRSSYRAGLLAGAGLTLIVIAAASAALWKTGALPDFIEARLPAASLPAGPTDSEAAASTIASTVEGTIKAPSADFAQPAPTPPTPIVLMVAPAPPPITNPTLAVDTLSAITAVQPDAPAVELDETDSLLSVISDQRAAAPAAAPQPMAAPVAGHPADSPVTTPTLRALKQLAERPSLKPDLDIGQFTGLEAMTAATVSSHEATVDQPQATPYVAKARPFIPTDASPLPSIGRSAAPTRNPETPTSDSSTRQTLSPLPPPIIIRSAGQVGGVAGAVSVEVTEQPADGDQRAASYDQSSSHSRRDAGAETDAGRNGGLGVAGAQSDGPSASTRGDDHGGNTGGGDSGGGTSGGGTDPGGDGGSGGSGGGSSGDGGSGGDGSGGGDGGDGSGGDGSGGDGDGGSGSDGGGDTDGGGGDGDGGGGSDGGSGSDGGGDSGGSDGGGGDGGDGGGGSDGGSGSDGGGDSGGGGDGGDGGGGSDGGSGSDGGDDSGGDTDGGGDDADGGDSDGSGDGGDGAGGDDGSASGGLGGALGGAIGGLGGALGGLGGN